MNKLKGTKAHKTSPPVVHAPSVMDFNLCQKTIDTLGGLAMIGAMILALVLANMTQWYQELVNLPITLSSPLFLIEQTPKELVKNVLMTLFFTYVGMELRHEFEEGFLSDKRQLSLPFMGALGGMILPGLVYILINFSYPENYVGFAIPCATDIAFAICLFNIIAFKLPTAIRILLLSIAIFDDLGAIMIIALFYTEHFEFISFVISGFFLIAYVYCRSFKVSFVGVYVFLGLFLCIGFARAGLHTTLAGFFAGFFLPLVTRRGEPFLKPLMDAMHPYVQFCILPLFAFTASGVDVSGQDAIDWFNPIVMGIVLGLAVGKPLGIVSFSYLTLWLRWAKLPQNSQFIHLLIISFFAGIGFTMSLFIGMLAFPDPATLDLVKIGVLAGSSACVVVASLLVVYETGWVYDKQKDRHPMDVVPD